MEKKHGANFGNVFVIIFGGLLLAIGLSGFTVPNRIASGGLGGLGTIFFHKFGLPVGMTILVGNIFLISMQAKIVGLKAAWKTILSVVSTSIFTDMLMYGVAGWKLEPLTHDPILACLYGGIFSGLGTGITFRVGGTSGGVDIIGQVLTHLRHIPVGDTILVANSLVSIAAGFAFGPELALYGLLMVFFSGRVIDTVLEVIADNRSVLIISKNPDEISWGIIEELHRGVTCLDGRGMYTGKPTNILLTAVRRGEMPILRRVVHEFDPKAFIIVGDARQVVGKGFVNLDTEVSREKDV